jgi:hypothetical protein
MTEKVKIIAREEGGRVREIYMDRALFDDIVKVGPAIKFCYELGFIPRKNEFRELTEAEYQSLARKAQSDDKLKGDLQLDNGRDPFSGERIYTLTGFRYARLGRPEKEHMVLLESEISFFGKAREKLVSWVEEYDKEHAARVYELLDVELLRFAKPFIPKFMLEA